MPCSAVALGTTMVSSRGRESSHHGSDSSDAKIVTSSPGDPSAGSKADGDTTHLRNWTRIQFGVRGCRLPRATGRTGPSPLVAAPGARIPRGSGSLQATGKKAMPAIRDAKPSWNRPRTEQGRTVAVGMRTSLERSLAPASCLWGTWGNRGPKIHTSSPDRAVAPAPLAVPPCYWNSRRITWARCTDSSPVASCVLPSSSAMSSADGAVDTVHSIALLVTEVGYSTHWVVIPLPST